MQPTIRIDTTRWTRGVSQLAGLARRRSLAEVGRRAVRGFVRRVVGITPPASGTANIAARKRGENAIAGDLFGGRQIDLGGFKVTTDGLFIVSNSDPNAHSSHITEFRSQNAAPRARARQEGEDGIVRMFTDRNGRVYGVERELYRPNASVSELIAFIGQYRNRTTGRVTTAGLRDRVVGRHVFVDKMVITSAAKRQLLKYLFAQVGILASGWNAAAQTLGLRLPTWITRHGTRHGAIVVSERDGHVRISIINRVPFVDNVPGLSRRCQAAINLEAASIERQLEAIYRRTARRAGFR